MAAPVTVASAFNLPLRIVTAARPPLVMLRSANFTGNDRYTGMLVDLLPQLLEAAGITRPYVLYPLPSGGGGSQLANGTWTGVMGELVGGRADMALFPLTMTSVRSKYISATSSFMDTGYSMLVKVARTDNTYSFLIPFQRDTWLLLLAALLVVVAALSLLDSVTRRVRRRALEKHYGLEHAHKRHRKERAMEHMTESIFMLMGQGSSPNSRSWAVRFLFVCWAIFSIIMLSAYTANLTANLTVSRLESTLRSLADLKRSGRLFGVPADSSIVRYFRDSRDGLASALAAAMIEYRDPIAAVADVRADKIGAYVSDYPVLKGFAAEPPCDLFVPEDLFGPGQLVIGLQPRSSLEEPLSNAMLQLGEEGVISELRRKWFVEMSVCAADNFNDQEVSSLTIPQVYPVFILLAVGMAAATVWALCETVYFRHAFSKVQNIKRSVSMKSLSMRGRGSETAQAALSATSSMNVEDAVDAALAGDGAAAAAGGVRRRRHLTDDERKVKRLMADTTASSSSDDELAESAHWQRRISEDAARAKSGLPDAHQRVRDQAAAAAAPSLGAAAAAAGAAAADDRAKRHAQVARHVSFNDTAGDSHQKQGQEPRGGGVWGAPLASASVPGQPAAHGDGAGARAAVTVKAMTTTRLLRLPSVTSLDEFAGAAYDAPAAAAGAGGAPAGVPAGAPAPQLDAAPQQQEQDAGGEQDGAAADGDEGAQWHTGDWPEGQRPLGWVEMRPGLWRKAGQPGPRQQ